MHDRFGNRKHVALCRQWLTLVITASIVILVSSEVWCPFLDKNEFTNPHLRSLVSCVNQDYQIKNMTWIKAMNDELNPVALAGVWWSEKNRSVPLTIVTQTSADRLYQLQAQCKSWQGPLSAAVYVALHQETVDNGLSSYNQNFLRESAQNISNLFDFTENDESYCVLDVMLAYEVFTELSAVQMLHPFNKLRNLARLQLKTPLMGNLDVDMIISKGLGKDLVSDHEFRSNLIDKAAKKYVFVIPAFEASGPLEVAAAFADFAVSRDKDFLIESVMKNLTEPFHVKWYPQGHNCTDFPMWYGADKMYNISYGLGFEPWTIVDASLAPWHDERFRGYGHDKIIHVTHMNYTGFQFAVVHKDFIIHREHPKTAARFSYFSEMVTFRTRANKADKMHNTTTMYGHNTKLFVDIQELLRRGLFSPTVSTFCGDLRR